MSDTGLLGLSQPVLLEALLDFSELFGTSDSQDSPVADSLYLDAYMEKLNKLCIITEELNYAGLQNACLVYAENIRTLSGGNKKLNTQMRMALEAWPDIVINYLGAPYDSTLRKALTQHLQLPVWDIPLPQQDAEVIEILLEEDWQQAIGGDAEKTIAKDDTVDVMGTGPGNDLTQESVRGQASDSPSNQYDGNFAESLPPQTSELVKVLLEELPLMQEPLLRLLDIKPEQDPDGWEAAIEVYNDYLDRFGKATEAIGFLGLQQVVNLMQENLSLLACQGRALSSDEQHLLASWNEKASEYLHKPHQTIACHSLIEWLQASAWPMPLPVAEAATLLSLLQAPELSVIDEEEIAVRPEQATATDITLTLPDDVNMDLLNALLQELPSQTETLSSAIQNLMHGGSLEDVNLAQRMAHTLKGAANTVGIAGISNLTHHLEDILVALAKHQTLPTHSLTVSLMNAADCLEAMGEALCGIGDPPDNAEKVLQEVLDWANRIDREGLPREDLGPALMPEVPPATVGSAVPQMKSTQESPRQSQTLAAKTQVTTQLVDNLLRLGGETIILNGQVHEQVRQIEERIRTMQQEFDRLQQLGGELERLIDIRDLSLDRQNQQASVEFDSLEMDQYNELHTTSRMLVETATDARQIGRMVNDQLQRLDKMLLTQERLNHEIQETVLSTRLVHIKTVVPRLQRSVRQTCRLTDKQVELHVSGDDILMDGEVLHKLVDPLMHVLRNAVDHGIESANERSAAGKPAIGNVWLDFLRDGNNILVRCRDDGAGIDFAAIRRSAERQGLLEPDQVISEEELKQMLLMPNFSTRTDVTQTSGRGVGLDVVYSHVIGQGGSLNLHSLPGKGCITELRLPLSLISTHALLVRLRDQVVAIADRGIEQVYHAADGTQREFGGQAGFWVDNKAYPLKSLDEILRLKTDRRTRRRASMPVLLVNTRAGVTAVAVQEILNGTDLVVKEFGHYVPRLPGVVGATILGDGVVTPVLDLPELISAIHKPVAQSRQEAMAESAQQTSSLPMALVADDSLSARRALVQVMEDAGYEVRAARDGMEAVQVIEEKRPDIMLVDMEMPRMNGIELTAHVRARPETTDLPVIMVTSRSTEKHRRQAEAAGVSVYLTKPFMEDELLGHVTALQGQK
jgi:chemosensory pili system protein ChpA (sensor histidine kinase/response regulator)